MSDLKETLDRIRAAFNKHGSPTYDERIEHLTKLEKGLVSRKHELAKAISDDFGHRSRHESLAAEVFVTVNLIRYVKDHLRDWMEPEAAEISWLFAPSTGEVLYQPLGVVGIISPWNYSIQLALAPLVTALAAGNRAMLKPSEVTPKAGEFLASLIKDTFKDDHVTVVTGGIETAKEFAALPFDHLFFTGSTRVGKEVMRAASENLVPVTLELGGKSPAIVGTDTNVKDTALRILSGKCFNAGQTCIAPDYVLVPKSSLDAFVEGAKEAVAKLYPSLLDNPDYTSIVNDTHYERLLAYLAEATDKGTRIVELNPKSETLPNEKRKLAPTLVIDPPADLRLMADEIFGPILPVKTYDTLDTAIQYVNDHPRPLALYYFGHRRAEIDRVLEKTTAGSVAVNETMLQYAQEDLPFGGVGASGMGNYHGRDGFQALSKKKSVFYQSRLSGTALFRPPYGKAIDLLIRILLGK